MLKPASPEQINAITAFRANNVILDSVAGSGKTTTILHIIRDSASNILHDLGQCAESSRVLVLTYNKRLGQETRQRIFALGLTNAKVYTYHAFCFNVYGCRDFTDVGIKRIVNNDTLPRELFSFGAIILDESQDMTPLYHKLVLKIIRDNALSPRICVMGDRYQSIYDFKYADERFITHADKLYALNGRDWREMKLNVSFRITREMAHFVNTCAFGFDRISAVKSGVKPKYVMCNTFKGEPLKLVMEYLKTYKPDDIFILAFSVRASKRAKSGGRDIPIRELANELTKKNIPIHVSDTDMETDEDILRGKIAITTFHQTKGLERKVVIIFGFDDSYFTYGGGRGKPRDKCPNLLYVAMTRASEHLVMLHDIKNDYLPFLHVDQVHHACEVSTPNGKINLRVRNPLPDLPEPVTNLIRFLHDDVIEEALSYVNVEIIHKAGSKIAIATKTEQGDLFEGVSDITGTAIPALFEYIGTGEMSINIFMEEHKRIMLLNGASAESLILNSEILLHIATEYCSISSGYDFKSKQITQYNWLPEAALRKSLKRLGKWISATGKFERQYSRAICTDKSRSIVGNLDYISDDYIYEIKCVSELNNTHILQLAIYAYLVEGDQFASNRAYRIINVITGEVREISGALNVDFCLRKLIECVIRGKYSAIASATDTTFIRENAPPRTNVGRVTHKIYSNFDEIIILPKNNLLICDLAATAPK